MKEKKQHRQFPFLGVKALFFFALMAWGYGDRAVFAQSSSLESSLATKISEVLVNHLPSKSFSVVVRAQAQKKNKTSMPYMPATTGVSSLGALQRRIRKATVTIFIEPNFGQATRKSLSKLLVAKGFVRPKRGDKLAFRDLKLAGVKAVNRSDLKDTLLLQGKVIGLQRSSSELSQALVLEQEKSKELEKSLREEKAKGQNLEQSNDKLNQDLMALRKKQLKLEGEVKQKTWFEKYQPYVVPLASIVLALIGLMVLVGMVQKYARVLLKDFAQNSQRQSSRGRAEALASKEKADHRQGRVSASGPDIADRARLAKVNSVRELVKKYFAANPKQAHLSVMQLLLDNQVFRDEPEMLVSALEIVGKNAAVEVAKSLPDTYTQRMLAFYRSPIFSRSKLHAHARAADILETTLYGNQILQLGDGLDSELAFMCATLTAKEMLELAARLGKVGLTRLFSYLDSSKVVALVDHQSVHSRPELAGKIVSALGELSSVGSNASLDDGLKEYVQQLIQARSTGDQAGSRSKVASILESLSSDSGEMVLNQVRHLGEQGLVADFNQKIVTLRSPLRMGQDSFAYLMDQLNIQEIAMLLAHYNPDEKSRLLANVGENRAVILAEELESLQFVSASVRAEVEQEVLEKIKSILKNAQKEFGAQAFSQNLDAA